MSHELFLVIPKLGLVRTGLGDDNNHVQWNYREEVGACSVGLSLLLVYTLVSPLGIEGGREKRGNATLCRYRKGALEDARTWRQKRLDEFVSLAE